jgi:hypothetical protein
MYSFLGERAAQIRVIARVTRVKSLAPQPPHPVATAAWIRGGVGVCWAMTLGSMMGPPNPGLLP